MRFNRQLEGVVFNREGVGEVTVSRTRSLVCSVESHSHGVECLSKEEIDALIKLYFRSGSTIAEVARTFRVSKETVYKILQTAKSYRLE